MQDSPSPALSGSMTFTFISVSIYLQELSGQAEQRGGVTSAYTFANKKPKLIDLILGLPAISLYDKKNKKMFSSLVNGIFTVPGIRPFLIGVALEQDKEAAV